MAKHNKSDSSDESLQLSDDNISVQSDDTSPTHPFPPINPITPVITIDPVFIDTVKSTPIAIPPYPSNIDNRMPCDVLWRQNLSRYRFMANNLRHNNPNVQVIFCGFCGRIHS